MNTYQRRVSHQSLGAVPIQRQAKSKPTFQLADNRPSAIAQRKRQASADNSPVMQQTAQLKSVSQLHASKSGACGCPSCRTTRVQNGVSQRAAAPAQLQSSSKVVQKQCTCGARRRGSNRHSRTCPDYHRVFTTRADRAATARTGVLTRSHSYRRIDSNGDMHRMHRHDNDHNRRPFFHSIGKWFRGGGYRGRR